MWNLFGDTRLMLMVVEAMEASFLDKRDKKSKKELMKRDVSRKGAKCAKKMTKTQEKRGEKGCKRQLGKE